MTLEIYPFVSIVLPAYNEAKCIKSCLESLKNLNYPKNLYEIILVDNGSTDETVQIARDYTDQIYILKGVNVAALRNMGTLKARGKIYAFIDADCTADTEWINNAVNFLHSQICITGSKCQAPLDSGWIEKAWFSQREFKIAEVSYINSGNLIVPANIFKKVGGFKETLVTGEDYEFCVRAKKSTKIISNNDIAVVHYGNPKTIKQFYRREIWHGLGAFGSITINHFDKPLIGTLLFLICTIGQIVGIISILLRTSNYIFLLSTSAILALLILTVTYRSKLKIRLNCALQLVLLYYFFYLGRSISIIYILTSKRYSRQRY